MVFIAIDQTDAEATQSPLLIRCAKGMALVLPVVAGLALYAIWLRVDDHGWSPEWLFILLVAGVRLAYGLVYAQAVLRGAGWMERIRQGNIHMALAIIALAALWLTPVLNAERISAGSQLARFEAGKTDVAELDLYALRSWGRPGAVVIAALEEKAAAPGQEALAAALTGRQAGRPSTARRCWRRWSRRCRLQPATATATRDRLLQAVDDYQLQDWNQVCTGANGTDAPGCLMVVADLLPNQPGEEAILFLQRSPDYTDISGLDPDEAGNPVLRTASHPDGRYPDAAEATALLRQYHEAAPPVTAVPLNQLGTGPAGLIFLP